MIKQDYQLQQLLDVEDRLDNINDRDIPSKVYVGEVNGFLHFCYSMGGESFLASFESPNVGRLVASGPNLDQENLRNMKYVQIEFSEALMLSLQKKDILGVLHFFNEDQYKKVYNGN